jgi:hypothetical protein
VRGEKAQKTQRKEEENLTQSRKGAKVKPESEKRRKDRKKNLKANGYPRAAIFDWYRRSGTHQPNFFFCVFCAFSRLFLILSFLCAFASLREILFFLLSGGALGR